MAARKSGTPRPLTRLRRICLALPGVTEVEAWGSATFRVKTMFAMHVRGDDHHGERESVWVKSDPTNQGLMVRARPDRYFVPPYVGPSGWVGVYIDRARTDWKELGELLHDAWRLSAPKKLITQHEAATTARKRSRRRV